MARSLPIACTLTDAELRSRRTLFLQRVAPRVRQREELANGIAWTLDGDAFADVTALLDLERECCAFLRLRIDALPEKGPIRVELTGPDGSGEVVRELLGI